MYTSPEKRIEMSEMFNKLMTSANDSVLSKPSLFRVLRYMKLPNFDIIDRYWDKVMLEIKNDTYLDAQSNAKINLAQICHNYSYFNNNLGGTYRYLPFERTVTDILMEELQTGFSNIIPSRFAKFASFIIGYGHSDNKFEKIPEFIVEKIESMGDQFTASDCLQLSRGIEILFNMRYTFV